MKSFIKFVLPFVLFGALGITSCTVTQDNSSSDNPSSNEPSSNNDDQSQDDSSEPSSGLTVEKALEIFNRDIKATNIEFTYTRSISISEVVQRYNVKCDGSKLNQTYLNTNYNISKEIFNDIEYWVYDNEDEPFFDSSRFYYDVFDSNYSIYYYAFANGWFGASPDMVLPSLDNNWKVEDGVLKNINPINYTGTDGFATTLKNIEITFESNKLKSVSFRRSDDDDFIMNISIDVVAYDNVSLSHRINENNADWFIEDGVVFNKTKTELVYYTHGKNVETYIVPKTVTTIWASAFELNKSLKTVTFETGSQLSEIGEWAFSFCSSLQSVLLPNCVSRIESYAFSDCKSLNSLTLPNSITSIGGEVFNDCSSLTFITYQGTKSEWGEIDLDVNWNFRSSISEIHCSNEIIEVESHDYIIINPEPEEVTINGVKYLLVNSNNPYYTVTSTTTEIANHPNVIIQSEINEIPVTSIGFQVFRNCSSLESIVIPNSISSVPANTFNGCTSLSSITIPDSVTSIGDGAFSGCSSLESITLPNTITSISDHLFDGCSSLENVVLPDSIVSIGIDAFDGCTSLASIVLPSNLTSIGRGAFFGCSSLASISLPNTVNAIDEYAFFGCSSLNYYEDDVGYYLGNSDNNYYAFMEVKDINIESCDIHDGCRIIYSDAFDGCTSLTSITLPSSIISIMGNPFIACENLDKVYINQNFDTVNLINTTTNKWKIHAYVLDNDGAVEHGGNHYSSYLSHITYSSDILADTNANHSYRAIGGWANWEINNNASQIMKATSVAAVATYNTDVANLLSVNDLEYLYYTDITVLEGSDYTVRALINDEVEELDANYSIKAVLCEYINNEYITTQWIPNPADMAAYAANVEALTDNIFIPPYVAEPDEHGFHWANEPVITSGAGVYRFILAKYSQTSSAVDVGYGFALIKLS